MAATLKTEDLQASTGIELVGKLFAEDDVRVFRPHPVNFHCRCSRARAEEVLRMLGEDDNQATVAEQGSVEVTCEYCGHRRSFDAIDISRLFAENAMAGPERAQ
jgi:molecular chaperone Hsp33